MNDNWIEEKARETWGRCMLHSSVDTHQIAAIAAALREAENRELIEAAKDLLRYKDIKDRIDIGEATGKEVTEYRQCKEAAWDNLRRALKTGEGR